MKIIFSGFCQSRAIKSRQQQQNDRFKKIERFFARGVMRSAITGMGANDCKTFWKIICKILSVQAQ